MNLFFSMPKIVNMFHILLIVLSFVFHPLNTDQGTSDKKAKQINRSDQSIEQAGMSINFIKQIFYQISTISVPVKRSK